MRQPQQSKAAPAAKASRCSVFFFPRKGSALCILPGMTSASVRLGLLAVLVGCGPNSDGDGKQQPPDTYSPDGGQPVAPGSIRIEPADAELSVSGGVAATLEYRAFLVKAGGDEEEVTSNTEFKLVNSAFGSFVGRKFTSATQWGGHTKVIATSGDKTGQTTLTVRLQTVFVQGDAPADSADKFTGDTDATRAPTIVYPNDGVLIPPNLNELEFHFLPAGNDLFEMTFKGNTVELKVYFKCQSLEEGCSFLPDESTWMLISDAERGEEPVKYALRGVSSSQPGKVGVSDNRTLGFGEQNIEGGIYYWNAAAGAIRRYDFGRRGQKAENYIDRGTAGATFCVGCHVVSRDGKRISVGMDVPAPAPYKVFDVASRDVYFSAGSMFEGGGANFYSFNPDASRMLTSNGVSIVMRDSTSGAVQIDPFASNGAMPDWSPDGKRVVYAKPDSTLPCFIPQMCGTPGVDRASLEVINFDGFSLSGATEETLVPFEGENNYYPSFSPDGKWVLFNRSPSNANSFGASDAEVWAVSTLGGAQPIRLDKASTGNTDSWPKWAPDVQPYRGRSIMWLTFSSTRKIGLRKQTVGEDSDGEPTPISQIWMAAFDPDRGEIVGDPSYPAFWLPFQEPESGNHIAQWVTRIERQPCNVESECASGELCEDGVCLPYLE